MATKPKMQVNTWEELLAKSATVAAKAEANQTARPTISMQGGMTVNGAKVPNDELGAIILDEISANVYYQGAWDPTKPESPDCYAFARTDEATGKLVGVDTWDGRKEMAPHKNVVNRVCDSCDKCPMNQWASADRGKGKACQNTRRVALIPGGTFIDGRFQPYSKPEQLVDVPISYLKVPPTSAKAFSAHAVQVANALARPLWGVFSKVKRVPFASYFQIEFSVLASIPNALMDTVFSRQQEAASQITFAFPAKAENVQSLEPRKKMRKYS